MTVNKERIELWAQALESERYVQCVGNLRAQAPAFPESGDITATWHCALGVGMEVAAAHGVRICHSEWADLELPPQVTEWYGLGSSNPRLLLDDGLPRRVSITSANDRLKLPFWDIAQLLRAQYVKEEGS